MISNDHIVQICPDGIITVAADGRVTQLNAAAEAMFGWAASDLVGQPIDVLIADEARAGHAQLMLDFSLAPDASAQPGDWRHVEAQRRDGSRFPVDVWLASRTIDGVTSITSFVRDMSELARRDADMAVAQGQLRQAHGSNKLLALVAQHASDIVIITDAAGVTIWVNASTEQISGYPANELIGRKPGAVLQGPGTDANVVAALSCAIKAGEAIRCEILNYTKSGSPYWIEMSISPVHDAVGQVETFIAVERDITAAKQRSFELEAAREIAARAEQRLSAAIAAMSEGFSVYDESDRLVMANAAFRNFRADHSEFIPPGISFEQMCRNGLRLGYFDTEGKSDNDWIAMQMRARNAATGADTLVKFADGRWMLRRDRRTAHGELISIRTDVTTIKQQEQELALAREAADSANRAKSDFVAMISHEIRTPISGIIGFNELMLASDLSEMQRERAELVKDSAEHLLRIVNNVLDLSKISSNGVALEPEPFILANLISSTVLSLIPLASNKGLTLACRSDIAPQACVIGDAGSIRQILINLIGNAIKFTATGSVTLSVTERGERIGFEIADTGDGIPDSELAVIFDRFSQLGTLIDRSQGAGLGLSISKRLIEMMKGTITVKSQVGHGSVFSVWLPLPRQAEGDDLAGAGREADEKRIAQMFDVLVAEDLELNQRLIREILDSIGCRVCMASNGQEALDRLETADFDLIIMDNQMPVMTGIEAIGIIRARPDWKMKIPIIALTANALRGTDKIYKALGVNEYITKPLNVQQVVVAVKRLAELGRRLREDARSRAG